VGYYQRLIVNPFLAIPSVVGPIYLVRFLEQRGFDFPRWTYLVGVVIALIAAYLLLHTHCVDCGETQLFHRKSHHACENVRNRWKTQSQSGILFPTPNRQFLLWLIIMPILAILVIAVIRQEL
jgi:hypothetical protein